MKTGKRSRRHETGRASGRNWGSNVRTAAASHMHVSRSDSGYSGRAERGPSDTSSVFVDLP